MGLVPAQAAKVVPAEVEQGVGEELVRSGVVDGHPLELEPEEPGGDRRGALLDLHHASAVVRVGGVDCETELCVVARSPQHGLEVSGATHVGGQLSGTHRRHRASVGLEFVGDGVRLREERVDISPVEQWLEVPPNLGRGEIEIRRVDGHAGNLAAAGPGLSGGALTVLAGLRNGEAFVPRRVDVQRRAIAADGTVCVR